MLRASLKVMLYDFMIIIKPVDQRSSGSVLCAWFWTCSILLLPPCWFFSTIASEMLPDDLEKMNKFRQRNKKLKQQLNHTRHMNTHSFGNEYPKVSKEERKSCVDTHFSLLWLVKQTIFTNTSSPSWPMDTFLSGKEFTIFIAYSLDEANAAAQSQPNRGHNWSQYFFCRVFVRCVNCVRRWQLAYFCFSAGIFRYVLIAHTPRAALMSRNVFCGPLNTVQFQHFVHIE